MHLFDMGKVFVTNNVSRFVEGAEKDQSGNTKYHHTASALLVAKQSALLIEFGVAMEKHRQACDAYNTVLERPVGAGENGTGRSRGQVLVNFLFRLNPASARCKATAACLQKLKARDEKYEAYDRRLEAAYLRFQVQQIRSDEL